MKRNILETLVGAGVLVAAVGFFVFAYKGSESGVGTGAGYKVSANFSNATGVSVGSDVRIGGIKIGVVTATDLDPQTYEAVIRMHVSEDTALPADSSAAIVGSGLLSDKFIQITPGGDEKMLADGGKIEFTQSSVSLEELIGKFVFSGGGVDKGKEQKN